MRVLIVPASRHGGTAEIGRAMARVLREAGIDVDVSQPDPMFDLAPYALLTTTGAVEHRLFGGRLERDRLGRTDRFVARWVGAADGDYREWDEIVAWAGDIARRLKSVSVANSQLGTGSIA